MSTVILSNLPSVDEIQAAIDQCGPTSPFLPPLLAARAVRQRFEPPARPVTAAASEKTLIDARNNLTEVVYGYQLAESRMQCNLTPLFEKLLKHGDLPLALLGNAHATMPERTSESERVGDAIELLKANISRAIGK
ncbi:hypothetical protein FYK55_00895 [Roseiconus nitratireducens]|uniref:Uncharacterized protein n=1 Tax=Roseiconus nitratireducens TaxID=2605748 RepID=A0A5M6DHI6_9BACT|nr:hypothetical protein [Roseiconus nitratireducens]KAA5547007.1 hypothetical protein FYK55_00895 [Roseiconus nitratireducens]